MMTISIQRRTILELIKRYCPQFNIKRSSSSLQIIWKTIMIMNLVESEKEGEVEAEDKMA